MFDIGWGELLLIGIVALVAIGPKELPGALRTFGQFMGKVRRMAGEFQNQFHEAMREAELADLKKEVDEMASAASSYSHFDPVADVRKEIESAVGDVPSLESLEKPAHVTSSSSTATDANAGADASSPPASEAPSPLPEPVNQSVSAAEPVPVADRPMAAPTVEAPKPDEPKASA